MTRICERCGSQNPDGARFCNLCGLVIGPVDEATRYSLYTRKLCPRCGAANSPTMAQCGSCGMTFGSVPASATIPESAAQGPTSDAGTSGAKVACPRCGFAIGQYDLICPNCRARVSDYRLDIEEKPRTSKPQIAGILMIGAGTLALVAEIVNASTLEIPSELQPYEGQINFCIGLVMVLGVVSILGGIVAYKRRLFPLAIVGAVAGMLTFSIYVGFFMGLIALILLALSQKEFD